MGSPVPAVALAAFPALLQAQRAFRQTGATVSGDRGDRQLTALLRSHIRTAGRSKTVPDHRLYPTVYYLYRWYIVLNGLAVYDLSMVMIHLYSARMYRRARASSRMIRRS